MTHSLFNTSRRGISGALFLLLAWLPAFAAANIVVTESLQRSAPARGAFGQPVGPYRDFVPESSGLRVFGPYIHSVTDTTVNVEWWLSDLARLDVSWRVVGSDHWQSVRRDSNLAGTFSLTGLEPGTAYEMRLRVRGGEAVTFADSQQGARIEGNAATLRFQTHTDPVPARNYHVAPDGSDSNSGTSRDDAWRSVTHAANRVGPGDTVWLAEGTYREAVRLRAAGETGRPITFRSLPGERVVFDGADRTLDVAFLAVDKPHQRFDGLYFYGYRNGSGTMPWRIDARSSRNNGYFVLYESPDIEISRCFFDSSGQGTGPALAHIRDSGDVLIENCVVVNAMGSALEIYWNSPRVVVRNNVFLRNHINQISPHVRGPRISSPSDGVVIENNIILDNLLVKVHANLVGTGGAVTYRNNLFYLRPERQNIPTEAVALLADPQFAWTVGRELVNSRGGPVSFIDLLAGSRNLDFADLFATNPEAVERGIGLQPEAFK